MKVKVTVIGRLFPRGSGAQFKAAVKEALTEANEEIQAHDTERTRGGRDVEGHPFLRYTPKYAKYGRAAKGLRTSPVDLTVTGKLLDTIKSKVSITGDTITLSREIAPSQQAKAEGLQKKRRFFGHSKRADEIIRKILRSFNLKALIK